MFSRILTFSVLSVFCVLTAISSVYADNPGGITTWENEWHDHDGRRHVHKDVKHRHGGVDDLHEHKNPDYNHDKAHTEDVDIVWIDKEERPDTEHTHSLYTHQHDDYVVHTHRGTHTHAYTPGDDDHTHPGLSWSFNHDRVGRRTDTTVDEQPVNQPTGNQPTGNQPTVNQPTVNQPTVTQSTGTQPTTVATGGTSEGTSEAGESQTPVDTSIEQNFLRAQQKYGTTLEGTPETQPERQPLLPIRITEYMVRDWSAGSSGLPQWIEVYNPNTEAVNLKGWTFQYATRRSANAPHKVHTLTIAGTQDGFSIAGGGVAILSTRKVPAWRFSGIGASQVYNLSIDNVLKRGWVLTDADGKEIHRLGRAAFSALGDPVAPLHQNQARVSHQVVPSESPSEVYYYGHREDMGSPGFYKQPAPAAPSAVRRKQIGTWADLKK